MTKHILALLAGFSLLVAGLAWVQPEARAESEADQLAAHLSLSNQLAQTDPVEESVVEHEGLMPHEPMTDLEVHPIPTITPAEIHLEALESAMRAATSKEEMATDRLAMKDRIEELHLMLNKRLQLHHEISSESTDGPVSSDVGVEDHGPKAEDAEIDVKPVSKTTTPGINVRISHTDHGYLHTHVTELTDRVERIENIIHLR